VKVILLGATGVVGQGVLRECLLDPEVESVLTIGRNASVQLHEKLHELVHQDLSDLSAIECKLSGYDACFFCFGVSAAWMKEQAYQRVTEVGHRPVEAGGGGANNAARLKPGECGCRPGMGLTPPLENLLSSCALKSPYDVAMRASLPGSFLPHRRSTNRMIMSRFEAPFHSVNS
jgi:hypothetical protein